MPTDNVSIVTPVTTILEIPLGVYLLIGSLAFTFFALMFKRPLLYLAVVACMVGLIIEPLFNDTWFQTGCVIVLLWAGLSFWYRITQGAERG